MNTITQKSKVLLCGIMAVALMAPAAWAQAPAESPVSEKKMEEKSKGHFADLAEQLKLTKEQKAQLDKNRAQRKAEFESSREKISAKRLELKTALESPELDIRKVTAIHNELKAIMSKREDDHLAAILEIRKLLTPEQFAQFQKMAPDRKGFNRKAENKKGAKGKGHEAASE
ncbi:MAG: Spy/CpxP family protein refolding chaperone [Candidatus Omnitrophica bacterium]|nr:Spy/CpxP family protein refolding chaperone [Candidatus Omnitrophota bacterium]